MTFACWMATVPGRSLRVGLGLAIVLSAVLLLDGLALLLVSLIGLVPIAAGLLNVCLVAPFIHAPFRGEAAERACR